MKCFTKVECQTKIKSLPGKISDFVKRMKPAIKSMVSKHRKNSVTPSTCNYDIKVLTESDRCQSEFLDLHFRFVDEIAENKANELSESYENERNEELEKRLRNININGENLQEATNDRRRPTSTPVRFYVSECGELKWAPLPDADIRCRGDFYVTECQIANGQCPVSAY